MTTPEKVRRRERGIIIGLVVILGLLVTSSIQDSNQKQADENRDAQQGAQFQACITDQITALTSALQIRSGLSESDFAAVERVVARIAEVEGDPAEVNGILSEYRDARKENTRIRGETKIPDFPNGKCDFG